MFDDDDIGIGVAQRIDTKLAGQQSMLVGISRGLDKLAGKRGGVEEQARPADMLVRTAVAELLRPVRVGAGGSVVFEKSAAEMARSLFPGQEPLQNFIQRAVTSPANTTTPGYASELVTTATIDFLTGGEAPSGFAQLAARTLNVGVQGSVKIPSRVYPVALAGAWIGEGAAKPVYTVPLTSIAMSPSKLAAVTAWSDEIAMYAVTDIEALVRDALRHDLGALLDSAAFDNGAATAVRPAGLFNGATSVTASTATPLTDAMLADLGALAAAVSANAPDARPIFVVNPRQALRLALAAPTFGDVIVSGYMPAGSVGAIDANSVVTMLGELRFHASTDAAVHMDTAASALSAVGSPNTVSAPIVSAFQANLVALRSVLRCSWAKRRTGATALTTGVSW